MAGFRGVPELTGQWLSKRTAERGGFIGVLHLVGVWVTGGPGVTPPITVPDTDGLSKREAQDMQDLRDIEALLRMRWRA